MQDSRALRIGIIYFFYAAIVLWIDTAASLAWLWPINWSFFRWKIGSFDLFKFCFWLLIPLAISIHRFDKNYYTFRGWKRLDFKILISLIVLATLCLLVIRYNHQLSAYYFLNADVDKIKYFVGALLWNISWLLGWEFLNRSFLLRALAPLSHSIAIFVVTGLEVVYHLQKPTLEMAGMGLLSIVLNSWAVQRNNGLLPLIVHGYIELALIIYLVMG